MKIICIIALLAFSYTLQAQTMQERLERAKQAAQDKLNKKIDDKVNKGLDKVVDKTDDILTGKNKTNKNTTQNGNGLDQKNGNNPPQNSQTGQPAFATFSKFDFIPGDRVVAFDDFKQDAIGDAPGKWNSSGAAEIVRVNNSDYNWVQLSGGKAYFSPQYVSNLAENCTIDFDMIVNPQSKIRMVPRILPRVGLGKD